MLYLKWVLNTHFLFLKTVFRRLFEWKFGETLDNNNSE